MLSTLQYHGPLRFDHIWHHFNRRPDDLGTTVPQLYRLIVGITAANTIKIEALVEDLVQIV